MSARAPAAAIDGQALLGAFEAAAAYMSASAPAVDAINVYPVPDGDTGSNMAATLREAVAAAKRDGADGSVHGVLGSLAKGALYGARGNSGVILSQALRGLAMGDEASVVLDAAGLAARLDSAAAQAFAAVGKPVEGTMLTVLRAAAEAAGKQCATLPGGGTGSPCLPVLRAALEAAESAEARTPEQLPALAEAGVTDAGGEGVCAILRGLVAAIAGEPLIAPGAPDRPLAALGGHGPERFGFCTEFILEPTDGPLEMAAVRALVEAPPNRSTVIVGDAEAIRVHVHTDAPDALLAAIGGFGRLTRTKVDDMSAQHSRFAAAGSGASARIALLALSPGAGFDSLFESFGAIPVPMRGVAKPAAGELAAAVDAVGAADVILLPNHANVVMAARQASELARCTVTVVPTTSAAQGIAAALAFDSGRSVSENSAALEEAAGRAVTIEVTVAAADRSADGTAARAGDAIALVDGRLVAAVATPLEALVAGLAQVPLEEPAVTIYGGEDVDANALTAACEAVAAQFPAASVEAVPGGQALYWFIASAER